MRSFQKGMARKPVLYAPQAAIGVVGNPALCPAFRVRRGRGRENGFVASRARRATRPTPSEFRRPCGHGADFSRRRACLGHRSPPASPCALPPRYRSRGRAREPARSRAGTPTGPRATTGSAGHDGKQPDARDDMARSTGTNHAERAQPYFHLGLTMSHFEQILFIGSNSLPCN